MRGCQCPEQGGMRAQPSSFQDIPGAPGMGLWVPLSPSVTFAPLPSILDGERRSRTFPASCAQHQEPNAAQSQPPTAPIPVIHREKEPPEPAQQTPGFGTPQTHNSIPRTRVEVTCQDQRSRTSVPRLWVKKRDFFSLLQNKHHQSNRFDSLFPHLAAHSSKSR